MFSDAQQKWIDELFGAVKGLFLKGLLPSFLSAIYSES